MAAALCFVQVRGAEHHGEPLVVHKLENDRPQFPPGKWINANGRLIQQQQVGVAHQRACQPQFLFHPAR